MIASAGLATEQSFRTIGYVQRATGNDRSDFAKLHGEVNPVLLNVAAYLRPQQSLSAM